MDKNSWLKRIKKAEKVDKFEEIIRICEGKNVLDVGCVGQDKSFESDKWLHGDLKKVSRKLIGVDINHEGIKQLNEKSFDVYHLDDFAELKNKFDVIVMGDVIEHVNDPGSFLSFYAKYLTDDGIMLVCTPNSFGVRYFIQVFLYGKPTTNEEHTLAFDPFVMLELFSRLEVKLVDFKWMKEYNKPKNWKQHIVSITSKFLIGFRSYFNPNFMFILSKK